MKKTLIAIFFVVALFGCQRIWCVTITDITDPSHPQFCVSRYKNCTGKGIDLPFIVIDEVTKEGTTIKRMWMIEPKKKSKVKEIIYGVPPEGWKEIQNAIPIEIGKWYRINGGHYYFRLFQQNEKIHSQVLTYAEFH